MAGKSPQPSHEPPFQAPITLIESVEGKIKGGVGGGMLKTTATKNHSGLLENNCYKTA